MSEFPTTACWTRADADAVLNIEALRSREAAFLAVHQRIRGFRVSGIRSGDLTEDTDAALLEALSARQLRHAFCVVEGEPGSGKSHLIRWLKVEWPPDNGDLVLLVPRADGSLFGTLQELQKELGSEYADLFGRLTERMEASFEGRVDLFGTALAATMRRGFFQTPPEDEEWCAKWELYSLLSHPVVRDRWKGPERVLQVMSGLGGERDSAVARFDLYDAADLGKLLAGFGQNSGLPGKALMLLRNLETDAGRLEPSRLAGISASALGDDDSLNLSAARQLVAALNRRRDFAVQNVLGISVDGLKKLFLDLRRRLKQNNRRLVLLLEDITSWEGLDRQLIDVLVTDAGAYNEHATAEEHVCDLVSVVGVTPDYMRDLRGNYEQRITHNVRLGQEAEVGQYQQTIQLADDESRAAFAANYLRATRAGIEALEKWRVAGADPADVPNRCRDCEVRENCHGAFGQFNGVGFYPFTAHAISQVFSLLRHPRGKMTLQTPRGMIQGVLSPVLLNPHRLNEGQFPPVELVTSDWLPQERLFASPSLNRVIEGKGGEHRERLRFLLMLWGDAGSSSTTTLADGTVAFASVPKLAFDSFRLPWPGSDDGIGPEKPPVVVGATDGGQTITSPDQTEEKASDNAPVGGGAGSGRNSGTTIGSGAAGGGRGPKPVAPSELRTMHAQISEWMGGLPLRDPDKWEKVLAEVMGDLPRGRLGVSNWLWQRLFTDSTVKLEGTSRVDRRIFEWPRTSWVAEGLEAYLALRGGEDMPAERLEGFRRSYARLLRRLGERVKRHVATRVPTLSDKPWSPAASCAQVLLARSWLRGTVDPVAAPEAQLAVMMSDETVAVSSPDERVPSWNEVLNRSNQQHDALRETLRQLVALPQGGADNFGLADAGEVAGAMLEMMQTLRLRAVPEAEELGQLPVGLAQLAKIGEIVRETDSRLKSIPEYERKRLAERAARLVELLRGQSIPAHAKRVDQVLVDLAGLLSKAATAEIAEWRRAYDKLSSAPFFVSEDSATRLEDFILDGVPPDLTPLHLLAFVITAPVIPLRQALDLFEKGETAIIGGAAYTADYLQNSGGGTASPEKVTASGRRLGDAVVALRTALEVAQ